mmetsp:Transcript_11430/g.20534  ORF Transcript_11430/g.20534 Transcript_11430/m.20534 type:complete len:289 (+) Transcript_11430:469-1335(+)
MPSKYTTLNASGSTILNKMTTPSPTSGMYRYVRERKLSRSRRLPFQPISDNGEHSPENASGGCTHIPRHAQPRRHGPRRRRPILRILHIRQRRFPRSRYRIALGQQHSDDDAKRDVRGVDVRRASEVPLRFRILPRAIRDHRLAIRHELVRRLPRKLLPRPVVVVVVVALPFLGGLRGERFRQSSRRVVRPPDRRGDLRLVLSASENTQEHGIGRRPTVLVAHDAFGVRRVRVHGLEPFRQGGSSLEDVDFDGEGKLDSPSFQRGYHDGIRRGEVRSEAKMHSISAVG